MLTFYNITWGFVFTVHQWKGDHCREVKIGVNVWTGIEKKVAIVRRWLLVEIQLYHEIIVAYGLGV